MTVGFASFSTPRVLAIVVCMILGLANAGPAAAQRGGGSSAGEPIWLRTIRNPAFLPTVGGALLGTGVGYAIGSLGPSDESLALPFGIAGSTAGTILGVWHGTGRKDHWAKQAILSVTGGLLGGAVGCLAGHFALGVLARGASSDVGLGCAVGFGVGQAYTAVFMQESPLTRIL